MNVIYACDIGSIAQGRFAWARVTTGDNGELEGSNSIDLLAQWLNYDLSIGSSIALGFESPLFVPVPLESNALGHARQGEGRYPFSGGAGTAALTLGIVESAWVLRSIFDNERKNCLFTTDWAVWPPNDNKQYLLCWEAFVSGNAHSDEHVQDAATAVMYFLENGEGLGQVNAVHAEPRLSLIQAVGSWSGWSGQIDGLHQPVLVLKPNVPYQGQIGPIGDAPEAELL